MFLWVKIEHAQKNSVVGLFSQVISSIYFWLYPEGQTPDVQVHQVQWEQCGHGFSSETEEMGMAVRDDGLRHMEISEIHTETWLGNDEFVEVWILTLAAVSNTG